jgi:DNA-directed RNA polymerase subunit E'/Rpb7
LVRRTEIQDDYYHYDEDEYALIGEITGKKLTLGDMVTVKVKKTNPLKKQIDFEMVYETAEDFENIEIKQNTVSKIPKPKRKNYNRKKR